MRAKFPAALTEILKTRIYISRELKVFTLEDVAKDWSMSSRTLYRYDSPVDRELSRTQAKRATEAHRAIDKTLCQICGDKLYGHKRCSDCTMLQHGKPECSCNTLCIVRQDDTKLILQLRHLL